MNELQFPFAEAPAAGERIQVFDGIEWVRLPLPFALDHVNCWLLSRDNSLCVIDTGVNTQAVRDCWSQVFAKSDWPDTSLITHFHPDHSGLSGLFAEKGAHTISSEVEWGVVQRLHSVADEDFQQHYSDWYSSHGVPDKYIKALATMGNTFRSKASPPPANCTFVDDGDKVELAGREYEVIFGRGHAPAMIMLYSSKDSLLIAADQILPSISPNISLVPGGVDENPLQSFLLSLERLSLLPEETLVLPSHGLPFTGLRSRIHYLQEHHQQRLADITEALAEERHAAALFSVLFKRDLDHQQLSFALGETLAHLKYLEVQSKVRRFDKGGVIYFKADTQRSS